MKIKFLAAGFAFAVVVFLAGCVNTLDGRKQVGIPFVPDTKPSLYERPSAQVFQAAKDVLQFNGVLVSSTSLYGQTNAINNVALVAEGRVNQRRVFVRVEQVDHTKSEVDVQARTPGGMADIDLAAEIDKQIALKLVR